MFDPDETEFTINQDWLDSVDAQNEANREDGFSAWLLNDLDLIDAELAEAE